MLPPAVADLLAERGHDAITPAEMGAHNLSDDVLIELASADDRIIVTENAADFAAVTSCAVHFVLKSWWPTGSLATRLAAALDRWADANPDPGRWPHWLAADLK